MMGNSIILAETKWRKFIITDQFVETSFSDLENLKMDLSK